MIDFCEIHNLIYKKDRTKESYIAALDLLSEPALGLEEAIRFLYMRDAYFRLGQKEKVIECGQLSCKYETAFFENKSILDIVKIHDQCVVIRSALQNMGICTIEIGARISEEKDMFGIVLKNAEFRKEVLTSDLEQEIDVKIGGRQKEERYFYYRAAKEEILKELDEVVPKDLYGGIVHFHIFRDW